MTNKDVKDMLEDAAELLAECTEEFIQSSSGSKISRSRSSSSPPDDQLHSVMQWAQSFLQNVISTKMSLVDGLFLQTFESDFIDQEILKGARKGVFNDTISWKVKLKPKEP